jgi:hypothetical protein
MCMYVDLGRSMCMYVGLGRSMCMYVGLGRSACIALTWAFYNTMPKIAAKINCQVLSHMLTWAGLLVDVCMSGPVADPEGYPRFPLKPPFQKIIHS